MFYKGIAVCVSGDSLTSQHSDKDKVWRKNNTQTCRYNTHTDKLCRHRSDVS